VEKMDKDLETMADVETMIRELYGLCIILALSPQKRRSLCHEEATGKFLE
jgi:hypothetical protein